jgi:hypothetical protein
MRGDGQRSGRLFAVCEALRQVMARDLAACKLCVRGWKPNGPGSAAPTLFWQISLSFKCK